ncbi:MAG: EthD family reductase [Chitinophagaceae bacterium]|nr:MAG: EthD family reductase [Chitinophagaceae bacterium]
MISCSNGRVQSSPAPGNAGFKVAILYPNGDGKTFDFDYYMTRHMPMVAGFIGENLQSYEIDKGISGRTATDRMPFLAVGYFYIRDLDEYNKAISQHRTEIIGDFKNYTNVQPVIQISEVTRVKNSKSR